jgi:hypothetical protein
VRGRTALETEQNWMRSVPVSFADSIKMCGVSV